MASRSGMAVMASSHGPWAHIAKWVLPPPGGAYEKRSIALTSNIHPAGFDELMPKTLATATVDRLLHHAHVLITDGTDSYRLAQATAGKGVTPLA
jgi:hypothetical protein